MNFVDYINDKEAFATEVKQQLNQKAFAELDTLKQQFATDFINDVEGARDAESN